MLYDTMLVIEEMMMFTVKYPSLLNVYSNGNAQAALQVVLIPLQKPLRMRARGCCEPTMLLVVIVVWTYLRWSSCTTNCGCRI
jgi:hypothetical protein